MMTPSCTGYRLTIFKPLIHLFSHFEHVFFVNIKEDNFFSSWHNYSTKRQFKIWLLSGICELRFAVWCFTTAPIPSNGDSRGQQQSAILFAPVEALYRILDQRLVVFCKIPKRFHREILSNSFILLGHLPGSYERQGRLFMLSMRSSLYYLNVVKVANAARYVVCHWQ